jgi:hypothetical protein
VLLCRRDRGILEQNRGHRRGIGGLAAALALLRQGIEPEIYEQSPPRRGRRVARLQLALRGCHPFRVNAGHQLLASDASGIFAGPSRRKGASA